MVIISKKGINDFIYNCPEAAEPLKRWYELTKRADWANFAEVKNDFNAADAVGNNLYVFNIGGNKYRLIVRIIFKARTVFIRFIGTHREYDTVNLSHL